MAPQREWFEKDYYKVLGVAENASEKDVTRAYRKLAKQFHPDANPGSEDRFKDISAAYDVLGEPARRKEYDEVRKMGPIANPFAGAGGPRSGGATSGFKVDDLGELLGGIFNRGKGARTGRSQAGAVGRRGDDLEAQLHLSFLEAVNGVTSTVNLHSDVVCSTCAGSGAAPGTRPVVCPNCAGKGVINDNQGLFSFSQPCPVCSGTGMKIETPCPTCHGRGVEPKARQVRVRIPAGVEDGQRIKIKGRGGVGQGGGSPGDLYVIVRSDRHPLFGRQGKNLTLNVPVTFPEAALGSKVTVPTLDRPVSLRLPPGTRTGRTFRVKGQGVPVSSGVGDLLVTVEVVIPEQLNDAERQAVEALAAAGGGGSPREHFLV